ncbi:MAG TPA: heme exporter protein CcmD [Rhodospirillales bacterium]|jgi:heme exporter protein D|nr:heme exporter protein CcmD [Rhodospirillales bacterium]HJO69673.1 heme exporter protein CcmD [Rhodospirillales bacterium]
MDSLAAFFNMGGYGAFVWPAFVTSGLVLIALLAASWHFAKAQERTLARLESDAGAGAGAAEDGHET